MHFRDLSLNVRVISNMKYNIARCSVWVWNLVADTEGGK